MDEIGRIIRNISEGRTSIFVTGDSGVVYLQESLKQSKLISWREKRISQDEYENPNAVYLKFIYKENIYTGIIETSDEVDSRGIMFEAPNIISDLGGNALNIIVLPFERIPLFPFFDIIDMIRDEEIEKLKVNYLNNIYDSDYEKMIKKWYNDYVNYRREIANKFIPKIEYVAPHWMSNLKLYIMLFDEGKGIATRYYYADNEDKIVVKNIIKDSNDFNELFIKHFNISDSEYLLTEGRSHSYVTDYITRANHPFLEAVKDIKELITKFNKVQPIKYYDAFILTKTMINHWCIKKIYMIRHIVNFIPELKTFFKGWIGNINVLNLYYIDKPERGSFTDGIITTFYVSEGEDKIITIQVKNKQDTRFNDKLIAKYFPESKGNVVQSSSYRILPYLEDKIGMRY